MKYSVATVLAAVAGVQAASNVTYTTEVVTAITTFCPAATMLTHAGTTYTITEVRFVNQRGKEYWARGQAGGEERKNRVWETAPRYGLGASRDA